MAPMAPWRMFDSGPDPRPGESMLSEAEDSRTEGQQSGIEGCTMPLAQDASSDSDCDLELDELDSQKEAFLKLGDGIWIHEKYLAHLAKPKDLDVLLYHDGEPGSYEWMAIAPEWDDAEGFGSSKEEACENLRSKLLGNKLTAMKKKYVSYIKTIPVEPCWKNAIRARKRWASYYDDLQNNSIAWEWGKISV